MSLEKSPMNLAKNALMIKWAINKQRSAFGVQIPTIPNFGIGIDFEKIGIWDLC